MIYKTIGVGGDYANFGAALQSLVLIADPGDDFEFDLISDVTELVLSSFNIKLYGRTATIKCSHNEQNKDDISVWYKINQLKQDAPSQVYQSYDYRNSFVLNKKYLYFNFYGTSGQVQTYIFARNWWAAVGSTAKINVDSCVFNAAIGSVGVVQTVGGGSTYKITNCLFYKGAPIALADYNATNFVYFENNTLYQCTTGISKSGTNFSNATVKNTVAVGSTTIGFSAGLTGLKIINCADSDNSIAASGGDLTDNITGITAADFVSVAPASADFLKINTTSDLYATGIAAGLLPENTASIEGYPRPNVFGVVSIGASEPNVAIDFTAVPLDPAIHDTVSFTSTINEATIPSYAWNLDDGKTSVLANPSDSYTVPGLKTISLTAYDNAGRIAVVTKTDYINVHNYELGFTAVPTKGQAPLDVQFNEQFAVQP